ncbi:hypothetical protein FIBSPDRAFT_809314 [Athelia psychrophila]|uniref:BSD domain-containing protein n=1 Tax=Athelia psychrophila TaxID=1759441 RepID=A0A166WY05_9AGAM|nr:hypothetical protein FIBSPDRAFT_809314 [Fibularhizoctonia sp. CBS 109695]
MLCQASASYKKLPGDLQLTPTHLIWTQKGQPAPTVVIPQADAASLFCSREGAAQVRLKLGLVNDDAGHNFTFTGARAHDEREVFKKELTNIIARNRAPPPPAPAGAAPAAASTPAVTAPIAAAPIAAAKPAAARLPSTPGLGSLSRAPSAPPTPIIPGADPAADFRLRKRVLLATPALAALHRALVLSSPAQLTESEFWAHRAHLLTARTAADAQIRGRPGQLVDPRPETVDGEIRIVITPQLVQDIFEEYPVVRKAYGEVGKEAKLGEAEFWQRYFGSRLFNAHRASIRSTAAQHVTKADPIFDKYLEKDDDELAPQRDAPQSSSLLVDLGATLEDHDSTSTTPDATMQAGRQRGALPLIRRFNEHSERLLKAAAAADAGANPEERAAKRQKTGRAMEDAIDLDDLRAPTEGMGIALEMQDRQRYFEGQGASTPTPTPTASPFPASSAPLTGTGSVDVHATAASVDGWPARLAGLRLERGAGDAALAAMSANVGARQAVRQGGAGALPPALLAQMAGCQTAANEFLRQFWAAVYPAALSTSTSTGTGTGTGKDRGREKAERDATAAKMAGYLGKTAEKVAGLVRAGVGEGVEGERVEVAMRPVLDAVERALGFWAARRR